MNFDPTANLNDGSCTYNVYGCTDVNAYNFNPAATINDNSCIYAGCTDSAASNYNANASIEDGSCLYPGCTDPSAFNYNPAANQDNGLCIYQGCTNPQATNYNPNADINDGSCIIPGCTIPNAENYNPNATENDGTCIVVGCTDILATNYNSEATVNSGCIYTNISGCTDSLASNYNEFANVDDGNCEYIGCTDPGADNYDPNALVDDESCYILGCTIPSAINYNALATLNDGTCIVFGCTDSQAANYNPLATINDGSCSISGCTNPIATNYNSNATIEDGSCIILGCTIEGASNYNPEATLSDGSCIYNATQANFTLSTYTGCAPLSITITNSTPASPGCNCLGACVYTVSDGTSITSCAELVNITLTQPGTYTITLVHNQFDGSTTYTSEEITVWPSIEAPVIAYNAANFEMLCTNCGSNAVTWQTDGVYWNETSSALSTLVNGIPNNGYYSASITNENGCFASSSSVLVLQPFFTLTSGTAPCPPAVAEVIDLTDPVSGATCTISNGIDQVLDVIPGSTFAYPIAQSGNFNITMTCTAGNYSGIYSLPFVVSDFPAPLLEYNQAAGEVLCTNYSPEVNLLWAVDNTSLPQLTNSAAVDATLGTNFSATFSQGECSATASIQVVGVDNMTSNHWQVYPNPTQGVLQLELTERDIWIEVFDVLGNKVHSEKTMTTGLYSLDLSYLSGGTYYLMGRGQIAQYRTTFVIQR
jgi:hypothetical protein